jgi:hypothetical protein
VAPLRGPRTHALVDRRMSQSWLGRSADFCRYGQASQSRRLSPNPAPIVRPCTDYTLFGADESGVPAKRNVVVALLALGYLCCPCPNRLCANNRNRSWRYIGGSHLPLFPIQQVVRPRTDAPQYCVGPPLGAVIVITPSARYLTPRHMMAAKQRT